MKVLNIFVFMMSLFLISPQGFADSKMEKKSTPNKEQRLKMAANMEKMAACLKSDKGFKDCRKEMKLACKADPESCPMMKGKMGNKGHHRKMMDE